MSPIKFTIEKSFKDSKHPLARVGLLETKNGKIQTPAFVPVGTKATVKALTPEMLKSLGAEVVLANTYHLYLQPGDDLVSKAGGLHKFMNWSGPTITDSGGFQVFSLGAAYNSKTGKISFKNKPNEIPLEEPDDEELDKPKLASIDNDGVMFRSHIDGSAHYITPEKSIDIQHNLGADIIFAFDECTSPFEGDHYQAYALDRTHRWAKKSLEHHRKSHKAKTQAIFGIVQGGRIEALRKESARFIGGLDFDGFGIGGSFEKEDMKKAVLWCNEILPEDKPRHLLGIGEPEDLFMAVENGCDLFDCVAPTRMARNGTLYNKNGRINILNQKFQEDLSPVESDCLCYTCRKYTRSYLCHLFRSKEMLAGTLASIHNLYFIISLVKNMRQALIDGNFIDMKNEFMERYYKH
jgi:queuine tRNA-ribosyltransferase